MRHLNPHRRHLANPLPIISGRVALLTDFMVDSQQGAGFVYTEMEVAELPDTAMYFAKGVYIMPIAREKEARWRLKASIDPVYKLDKSYDWREATRQIKENGAGNVASNRPLQTD